MTMKKVLLQSLLLLLLPIAGNSQEIAQLRAKAYELYPTLTEMYGFAVAEVADQALIIGGLIKSDVPEIYDQDFPNREIILIDYTKNRASAFSSGGLDNSIGEQMAATGLGYYQEDGILYILGGYGYSESNQRFITFRSLLSWMLINVSMLC